MCEHSVHSSEIEADKYCKQITARTGAPMRRAGLSKSSEKTTVMKPT
jgi:hypothetical protein